ncbi:MAG TPA: nuclear transport factor 2 family protein [Chthonomonadales bacterium]|nr:nuclear transport factor 2 family protein [Chthonomonadales bacterium]
MEDISDLRRTFEQMVHAYNSRNPEVLSALLHDTVVAFTHYSPFPTDGKSALQRVFQALLTHTESATMTLVNVHYRNTENTGVVYGVGSVTQKPKDGPVRTIFDRQTWIFTKVDGRWLLVAVHLSLLPSGN